MAEGPPYKDAASVPKGTPTPTQEELNKINTGESVELAKDGTPDDTANLGLRGGVIGAKAPSGPATGGAGGHTATPTPPRKPAA